jgi:hypothetical protein
MDSLEPRWASVLNRPKLGFVPAQAAAAPPKPATIRATTAGRHVRVAVRKLRSSAVAIVELPPVKIRE